jgi:hypothetical protein
MEGELVICWVLLLASMWVEVSLGGKELESGALLVWRWGHNFDQSVLVKVLELESENIDQSLLKNTSSGNDLRICDALNQNTNKTTRDCHRHPSSCSLDSWCLVCKIIRLAHHCRTQNGNQSSDQRTSSEQCHHTHSRGQSPNRPRGNYSTHDSQDCMPDHLPLGSSGASSSSDLLTRDARRRCRGTSFHRRCIYPSNCKSRQPAQGCRMRELLELWQHEKRRERNTKQ